MTTVGEPKELSEHVEETIRELGGDLSKNANVATEEEHQMTMWQAIVKYRKACFWSMFISLSIIMDSYDQGVIGNFVAYPSFQKRFGILYKGEYVITTPWQVAISMATPIGRILGAPISGLGVERFGRRWLMIGCLIAIIGFIFIQFFAQSLPVLLVGEILASIIWGSFNTIVPTYASEVAPVALRGFVEMYIQLSWGFGNFISMGVLRGLKHIEGQWSYKIAFAIQWVWPLILLAGLPFAPESPWWHVRRGEYDKAKKMLQKLGANLDEDSLEKTMALYVRTDQYEHDSDVGVTYKDCFKGTNRRRTEICAMVWSIQSLCGSNVGGSYFFEQAGLSSDKSFDLSLGSAGLNVFAELLAILSLPYFGRRKFYNYGLFTMTILMLIMGCMSFAPKAGTPTIAYPQAGLMMFWQFVYHYTIGPVNYVIIGEISATKLRGHTISLGLVAYSICIIVLTVVTPYMLNPTAGNLKGKICLFYFGVCFFCCLWAHFRLPETKGRTFEEIDHLFNLKLPARKFGDYKIDLRDLE